MRRSSSEANLQCEGHEQETENGPTGVHFALDQNFVATMRRNAYVRFGIVVVDRLGVLDAVVYAWIDRVHRAATERDLTTDQLGTEAFQIRVYLQVVKSSGKECALKVNGHPF